MTTEIYLDGNATSSVLPAAVSAAAQAMAELYGNPSSTHAAGLKAKAGMDAVRQRARRLLGVGEGRLMFNSGATEGIQTAMLSALCALRERRAAGQAIGSLLVYGATEHKAVPESLAHWNRLLGLDLILTSLPVDSAGQHDLATLRALAPDAALVCTMAANNETGAISDLPAIAAVLAETGSAAYWLVDCVQALGKLELNLAATRIDYAPFSGHKLYAPKGIGMLYVRAGAPFTPLIMGGGQEAGQRSGTENMAGIAALGAVLAALEDGRTFRSHAELTGFRNRLADALRAALPGIEFNTPFATALPTTLNFSVPGLTSKELLDVFDAAGVRVSSGSACSAAKAAPSYVLEAMQVPRWRSEAAIRMSFGALIDDATVATACERIARCGAALRSGGLLPASDAVAAQDSLLQLTADGACSWLVADAASGSCVIIDPHAALVPRLAAWLRHHGVRLRAVLHTAASADGIAAQQALEQEVGLIQVGLMQVEPMQDGLLADGFVAGSVVLADGTRADGLRFGRHSLARLLVSPERAVYLLDREGAQQFVPQYVFHGTLDAAAIPPAVLGGNSLLCSGTDENGVLCSTLNQAAAGLDGGPELQLEAAALDAFLQAHPEALLVDVRETYEAAAGPVSGVRAALRVPVSRLPGQLSDWLAAPQVPLVFFCRSGNRSQKAAACLRRLGHANAFSMTGGVALGGAYLAAPATGAP